MSSSTETQDTVDALSRLAQGTDINALAPEALSVALSEQLPVLADTYRTITVRLARGAELDQVLDDLERGITLRVLEVADDNGVPRRIAAEMLDPATYPLPLRMRNYALFWPVVEIRFPPSVARQMASDLARGIAARGASARAILNTYLGAWDAQAS